MTQRLLALFGRRRTLDYAVQGAPGLQLHQDYSADAYLATGARVWPAARVLAEFLLRDGAPRIRGRSILELGAGTGAVGLACAIGGLPARVLLSDRLLVGSSPFIYSPMGELVEPQPDTTVAACANVSSRQQLDLLSKNVQLNTSSLSEETDVKVAELNFATVDAACPSSASGVWEKHGPFDLAIGSDICYNRDNHDELAQCLLQLHNAHDRHVNADGDRRPFLSSAEDGQRLSSPFCITAAGSAGNSLADAALVEGVATTRQDGTGSFGSAACGSSGGFEILIAHQLRLSGCWTSLVEHLSQVGLAAATVHDDKRSGVVVFRVSRLGRFSPSKCST